MLGIKGLNAVEPPLREHHQDQEKCPLNPLSPNSDHRLISPCNIDALSMREVMRIQDMIIKDELC